MRQGLLWALTPFFRLEMVENDRKQIGDSSRRVLHTIFRVYLVPGDTFGRNISGRPLLNPIRTTLPFWGQLGINHLELEPDTFFCIVQC